jgi:aspartate ammonia-lyase
VATGKSIIEIAREKGWLTEKQIAEILDAKKMTGE